MNKEQKPLSREQKIKVLQAIREGRMNIEDLEPPQVYIFVESSQNPGIYTMKDKQYNEPEYREFCQRLKSKNNNSIIWNEKKTYLNEDKIITLRHSRNNDD